MIIIYLTMNYFKYTSDLINVSDISELVTHPECNAISVFIETCKSINATEYLSDSDVSNGKIRLRRIGAEIRRKWKNVMHIAIHQKIGHLNLKDINIVVAVSSPYLSDSTEAMQYAVNEIKTVKISVDGNQYFVDKYINSETNLNVAENYLLYDNYDACVTDDVSPELIQIKADNNEINNRIQNFIFMKRTVLDSRNIKEFLQVESGTHIQDTPKDPQCARVDAILWKRNDSKSHLKVHKVINEWGPQAPKVQPIKENVESSTCTHQRILPNAVDERITNCEKHMGIDRPVSADVYARLKQIEDRILELDSISPEYSNFWIKKSDAKPCLLGGMDNSNRTMIANPHERNVKRKYTLEELSLKISKMKKKFDTKFKPNEL